MMSCDVENTWFNVMATFLFDLSWNWYILFSHCIKRLSLAMAQSFCTLALQCFIFPFVQKCIVNMYMCECGSVWFFCLRGKASLPLHFLTSNCFQLWILHCNCEVLHRHRDSICPCTLTWLFNLFHVMTMWLYFWKCFLLASFQPSRFDLLKNKLSLIMGSVSIIKCLSLPARCTWEICYVVLCSPFILQRHLEVRWKRNQT